MAVTPDSRFKNEDARRFWHWYETNSFTYAVKTVQIGRLLIIVQARQLTLVVRRS